LFTLDRRKIVEEFIESIAAFKVIKKALDRYPRSAENWCSA